MIKNIFPTPIWITSLSESSNDNIDVVYKEVERCLDMVKKDNLIEESENSSFFKSTYFSYLNILRNYPILEEILAQECIKFINSVNVGKYDFQFSHSWINISNEGEDFHFHTHFPGLLSGVLYLKVPIGSGNIVFKNPVRESIHEVFPFTTGTQSTSDHENLYSDYLEIVPKNFTLIIFPSWLEHKVEKNNSKDERISLAFNCKRVSKK